MDEAEKDSDQELYESSDSSDEDRTWTKEVKKQHRMIRKRNQDEHEDEEVEPDNSEKVYEFSKAPKTTNIRSIMHVSKKSLGERLAREGTAVVTGTAGNREMKFTMRDKKRTSETHKKMKKHYEERKQIVRRTGHLIKKRLPKML